MVLTLTIPEPGEKKRIKDIILDILSFDWPLTLSQIHNRVGKSYGISTTCQATYKAMNELVQEGVLTKQDKLYSINLNWIEKIKDFSVHIENNYKGEQKVPLIDGILKAKTENNVTVLTFTSALEMDKMWLNIKKDYYKNLDKKNDVTFWEGSHCWWLLIYPEMEYAELAMAKSKKVRYFFINHGTTSLDKYAKKFYESSGINFKLSDNPSDCDMAVFGDTIMQVYLPKEIKDKIEELYKNHRNSSEINIPDFISKILTKKVQINLILTKNKEIAEQLKKKVVAEFNQKV